MVCFNSHQINHANIIVIKLQVVN